MAAFSTEVAAEGLAKSRMAAGTYIEAHVARTTTGAICIRALMPVTSTGGGGWVEITDDGA